MTDLPNTCFGSRSPGRARNLQLAYVTSPVTRRKMPNEIQSIQLESSKMERA